MIQVAAGLVEFRPLLWISDQDVAEHGIIQALEAAVGFSGDLETFELGTGQPGFKLLNAMPRKRECVNRASRHQNKGGNQNPKAKAKGRFHNYFGVLRLLRSTLRWQTTQVPCREE
jgi:hypothetical protein